jgi:hypothetical protein
MNKYILEVREEDERVRVEGKEWYTWTKGSLQDCLSDFFYLQNLTNYIELRLSWKRDG